VSLMEKKKIKIVKEILAYIYANRCVSIHDIKRFYEEKCKEYECAGWSTVAVQLTRYKQKGVVTNPFRGIWCRSEE